MIWFWIALAALAALAPLGLSIWRPGDARQRRQAALALHRAQLRELDRDLAVGRIGAPEHAVATLEVQRRILAEAALDDTAASPRSGATPLIALAVLLPALGLVLYLTSDPAPGLPAAPLAARLAEQRAQAAQASALVTKLQAKIATLDPHSDLARQGYVLLGNLEDTRNDLPQAADAWSHALAIRFDPTLAAEVAEARSRIEGRVSPQSAALFRQALAAAPADAPWRGVAEQRLASVGAAGSPPPP
jgi:cytochrome c-type biogenesis protein CcmH